MFERVPKIPLKFCGQCCYNDRERSWLKFSTSKNMISDESSLIHVMPLHKDKEGSKQVARSIEGDGEDFRGNVLLVMKRWSVFGRDTRHNASCVVLVFYFNFFTKRGYTYGFIQFLVL